MRPEDIITQDDNENINKEEETNSEKKNEEAIHSAYKVPDKSESRISYHLSGMYQHWFLDYASYVILERAVPHINDGLKPVQRRILHSMKRLDDGRYNKVANIVGHTMQFHPHGDASIGDALVQLGQKDLLIDCQGNWGNILTGDSAAAPRYIEARLSKFALETVFNPKTTVWQLSYDGRNREPVTLPVKFPLLLAQGVEGIAVGLSSKILPHNFNELLDASVAYLKGENFALYAFTDCEVSISPNCCVIMDNKPHFMTVSEVLKHAADETLRLLRMELEIQKGELEEQLFFASLEKIFIEERIYKDKEFEEAKDMDEAIAHIDKRLEPFKPHFIRSVTRDDILKLMEIKMGRILKFNADKCNALIAQYKEEIARIVDHLTHIVDYTIQWFLMLKEKYGKQYPRLTKIQNFDTIEATKVVEANEKLYINRADGFIGTSLKKDEYVCNCSDIDDIIIFYRNGTYKVVKVSEKMFVGKDILYLNVFKRNDNRTIYNVVYRDGKAGYNYIKRFAVTGVTRDKEYTVTKGTEGSRILYFSANSNGEAETVKIILKPKPRQKLLVFEKDFSTIAIKGRSSMGNILTKADIHKVTLKQKGSSTLGGRMVWFDRDVLRLNYDGRGEELGEFQSNDQIMVILQNGDFYTTNFDLSNHYESTILNIEKFDSNKVWTAALYDADQQYGYLKRFQLEAGNKRQNFVGDNPKSRLLLLTDEAYPRIEVVFGGHDAFREPLVIDAEEFVGVKGFKAKGKRLSTFEIETVNELEPIRFAPAVQPAPAEAESVETEETDTDAPAAQSHSDILDEITGQMKLFEE